MKHRAIIWAYSLFIVGYGAGFIYWFTRDWKSVAICGAYATFMFIFKNEEGLTRWTWW